MSVTLTNLLDVVLDADGTPANGRVVVYWPMFMVNGTAVTQGQRAYEITDGQLDLNLYPTVSAQPNGSYYTATFELDNGSVYDEYWVIPNQTTVKLNQIRAMFPPAPGLFVNSLQITGGGAQNGQFLGWNGTQWVPMYVTTLNVSPNFINFAVSATPDADLSVLGSPVTLGGVLTLNVPDAGPTSRGVVTTGPQTFAGAKTFTDLATFSSSIVLSSFIPATPQWGQVWFDDQNVFHLKGSLQLHGIGENLGMLQIGQIVVSHLDVSQAGLSNVVVPRSVVFPGQEAILLPRGNVAHGIGVDAKDWLWLGSGQAFASLRPDAAWVANWIDLSPYQHPIAQGVEAVPSQASIVLYQDATQWIGMGVDNAMRVWFRMGPNWAGQYYYLAPDGGSLGVNTWVNSQLVAQRAGINLIAGQYVTMTATDNLAQNTVDVVITAVGNLVDPTTTRGDLIVRDALGPTRLPAIYDGEYRVLTCDPWHHPGLSWTVGVPTSRRIIAGAGLWGGGDLSGDVDLWANVQSVFGRTGNIVLTGADLIYAGAVMDPTLIKGDLIVRSPWLTVNRGLTRLGAGASDGVVDGSILVTDSTLDLGLKWVPGSQLGAQTPWIQDVDGDGYTLFNVGLITGVGAITAVGQIGIGTATPAHTLDVVGDGAFSGDLSVGGNFDVTGTSTLTGDVSLGADFDVTGDSTLGGNLDVAGNGAVAGDFSVGGDITFTGDTILQGALTVAGDTTLQSDLAVTGDTTLTGTLGVTGDSAFGNIAVTGTSGFTGDMTVTGDFALTGDTALNGALEVTGDSEFLGSLDIGANLDVGGVVTTVGDVTVGGDLNVVGDFITGGTLINGNLTATGDSDLQGDVVIGGDLQVATISSGSTTPVLFTPPLEAGYIDLNPDINTWGNVQAAITAMQSSIETLSRGMSYVGSYDAANDIATFVPSLSALDGPLPAADAAGLEQGDFLIATSDAAGPPAIQMGDQLISGGSTGGPNWDILNVGHVSMTASMVAVTAATGIPAGWTTVQAALADIAGGAAQTPWLSNINADGWALCSGSTTNALVFSTGTTTAATERMRVTAAGNVGIGNDLASMPFGGTGPILMVGSTTATSYGAITACANTTVAAGGIAGSFLFVNYAIVASPRQVAQIACLLDGAINSGALTFLTTSAGTQAERMRITSAGYVGIGTVAPSTPLHVHTVGTNAAAAFAGVTTLARMPGDPNFRLQTFNGDNVNTAGNEAARFGVYYFSTSEWNSGIRWLRGGGRQDGSMLFDTYGLERMRITAAGDVGIGNDMTVPPYTGTGFPHLLVGPTTTTAPGVLGFLALCRNTSVAGTAVGGVAFANYANTGTEKRIAEIDGLRGTANNSGNLVFYTWNAGTVGERMRITELGYVGIGTDAAVLPQSTTPLRFLIIGSSTNATNYGVVAIVGNTANVDAAVGDLSFANYNITAAEKRLAVITGRTSGAVNSGALVFYTMNAGSLSAEAMRITPIGNVGIGNAAPLAFATAASYPQLQVGLTTASIFHGFFVACGNVTALANPVGAYAFANFAITGAEKRIAEIHAATDGAINSGCLRFYTWNAGANAQRMRITALGTVGIGNDGAPMFAGGNYMHLIVGSAAAGGTIALAKNVGGAGAELGFLSFANYALTAASNKVVAIIGGTTGAQTNSGRLLFYTYNQGVEGERMRILETGQVGIGTQTPGAQGALLEVNGNIICGPPSSSGHGWLRIRAGNAAGNEAYVSFIKQAPAASAQEWQIGLVDASGNYVLWGSNATVPSTIHWTATPGGNFGIGAPNPTYQLQLSADSAAKPGTNTWTIISDMRTKRNVEPFDGGIETIRQLQPIVAEYNGMASMPNGQRVVSLDPAKLREILPHAVSSVRGKLRQDDEEETDILGVNTHEIFYHMLRAIQQLDREVRQLRGEKL